VTDNNHLQFGPGSITSRFIGEMLTLIKGAKRCQMNQDTQIPMFIGTFAKNTTKLQIFI
jgi:hypothetical protein